MPVTTANLRRAVASATTLALGAVLATMATAPAARAADGTRWGRPVAAVVGPDGAVYVTDDAADAIYRVAPPGR